MKNKILFLTIAAVGALLITATNGFSKSSYGSAVNTACAPAMPFDGSNCNLCHIGSDRGVYTDAMDAYVAGGNTLTDYFCPDPTPACIDNDGDGFGDPGSSSCSSGSSATDCDDRDAGVNPDATEDCTGTIDKDCNGYAGCLDSYCAGDPVCWADNCIDYGNDRAGCKADSRCNYSRKKGCQDIDPPQLNCQDTGGRWNKKKETCTYR
jgi:hypothetical protein